MTIQAPDLTIDNLEVIGDRLLVVPAEPIKKTKGGILLPEDAQRRPQYGRVIKRGDDLTTRHISVGDWVSFPQYVGIYMKLRDKNGLEDEYLLMEWKNISGRWRQEAAAAAVRHQPNDV